MRSTSKIHDCKIIALSLVLLVSTFDKVMVVLRKKNNNCVMVLKIRPSVALGHKFGCGC